jgi:hypothetical protein
MRIPGTWTIAAAALSCSLAIVGPTPAPAATLTYSFSEAGWLNSFGTTENFSGSFTGTPEANGDLALADLTSFVATMTETNAQGATKNVATFGSNTGTAGLADFLYMPGSNSLTLEATGSPTAMVCLGNDVATGFCGPLVARPQPRPGTPPLPPIEGLFSFSVNGALNAYTTDLPSVVQTVGLQPVPAPSTAPEPAPVVLCGATLVLASTLRRGKRGARSGQ